MVERAERSVARVKAGRRGWSGAAASAALVTMLVFAAGCGQAPSSTAGTTPVTVTPTSITTTEAAPVSSTSAASSTSTDSQASSDTIATTPPVTAADVEEVFAALAASVQPMKVFAPTVLPAGAALAPHWLPVVESQDLKAHEASGQTNPRLVGTGPDSEIQVVFQAGSGWLVVIENFHGDLGDVPGTPVGKIGGNPAALFQVNGGELVQWSQDGRWYGLFARGVNRDAILAAALGMKTVSTETPRT